MENNFETYLNKNYREELLAEKFRKNELRYEFIFQSFTIHNLSIFVKRKIKPVFLKEIFTKKTYKNNKQYSKRKNKIP